MVWPMTLVVLAGVLAGCNEGGEYHGPQFREKPATEAFRVYHLAVHPLYNPAKLMSAYQPLVDYLNSHLTGIRLELEASRDYASFEDKYRARRPELLLPNPWQTLDAMKVGYGVIAMAGEPEDFRGIFLVRREGGIENPADLRGRVVSYPSRTALAGCIMPQFYLHDHGIDIHTEIENRYVGSQESSIMSVYLGLSAAGATWPVPWRAFQKDHPRESAELKVIWETSPLVNNSVMIRDDVPLQGRYLIRELLIGLNGTDEGKAILAGMEMTPFIAASDEDYRPVDLFISRFERDVRPVGR